MQRGPGPLACIEVGGSGTQTVVFHPERSAPTYHDGVHVPAGADIALAVPGHITNDGLVHASSLRWCGVRAEDALSLPGPPAVFCNDAEAAALGEWVRRGAQAAAGLVYVGLGTGIGGAVVRGGTTAAANLFGHEGGYSDRRCACGSTGCLETVAAGWALPTPLPPDRLDSIATAVATAVAREPAADGVDTIVITGGVVASHPALVDRIASRLAHRTVVASSRPAPAKSAAAWGLRHLHHTSVAAERERPGQGPSGSETRLPPVSPDR